MLVFFFVVSLFGFRVATVLYSFVRKALGLHFKMQFVWHMIFFIDASLALSLSLSGLAHKSRQFIYDTIYNNGPGKSRRAKRQQLPGIHITKLEV